MRSYYPTIRSYKDSFNHNFFHITLQKTIELATHIIVAISKLNGQKVHLATGGRRGSWWSPFRSSLTPKWTPYPRHFLTKSWRPRGDELSIAKNVSDMATRISSPTFLPGLATKYLVANMATTF